MTPGEYLYSDSMYHDDDTIWHMYDDNDEITGFNKMKTS